MNTVLHEHSLINDHIQQEIETVESKRLENSAPFLVKALNTSEHPLHQDLTQAQQQPVSSHQCASCKQKVTVKTL